MEAKSEMKRTAAATMLAITIVGCLAIVTMFAVDRQAKETLCRLPDADAGLCLDVDGGSHISPEPRPHQPARHNWQTAGYFND